MHVNLQLSESQCATRMHGWLQILEEKLHLPKKSVESKDDPKKTVLSVPRTVLSTFRGIFKKSRIQAAKKKMIKIKRKKKKEKKENPKSTRLNQSAAAAAPARKETDS